MGKCLFMRKGETHTEPSVYIGDPVFANNDWATIIKACQKNKVHPTWNVGDSKSMTINGTSYAIDIIGKNHDAYATGGTAPLTFQMHNCYATEYSLNASNTNRTGWTNCVMRQTTLPSLLALMPSEVKSGIKEVTKRTSVGAVSSTVTTSADKLFLLSEIEVFGKTTYSAGGEGSQYAYYKAGNSVKKYHLGKTTAAYWWLRSPCTGNDQDFHLVTYKGKSDIRGGGGANAVAFAFCF